MIFGPYTYPVVFTLVVALYAGIAWVAVIRREGTSARRNVANRAVAGVIVRHWGPGAPEREALIHALERTQRRPSFHPNLPLLAAEERSDEVRRMKARARELIRQPTQ